MCYDAYWQTKSKLDYAKRFGAAADEIEELERQLGYFEDKYGFNPYYHKSGFSHPNMLVYVKNGVGKFDALQWGLIPFWCKDEDTANQVSNKTINARGESMFEKPSYRKPAKDRRCIVLLDGFFEHHHYRGKTYPFLIKLKSDEPMLIGGIWDEWTNKETGEVIKTVSIVTTAGNSTMAKIHNNPKLQGPRMPFILHPDLKDKWLMDINDKVDQEEVQNLIQPYPDEELSYYTVRTLRGKKAIGNNPEALEEFRYPELVFEDKGGQISIF